MTQINGKPLNEMTGEMTGEMTREMTWFKTAAAREKIRTLPEAVHLALMGKVARPQDGQPGIGRDVAVCEPSGLPPKPGLGAALGQARLLHDLASIELQAMELAVRGLCDFPLAPQEFREELANLAFEEGRHLTHCLDGLEALGFAWGHWPVHLALWNAVNVSDTLLDRIVIVHRHLEGSGIDAGESILRRLVGAGNKGLRQIVQTIVTEEVDHVRFGSRWYRQIAREQGLDPDEDFAFRIEGVFKRAPRKERLAREARIKAGFTERELDQLERLRF